ncbi:MAG: NUDIX domain-containing protein [Blastochloris viridis]|uniref:NUDIX domain-containing protein n=1 Tax=Blastochloris viridis TaxID=1079 RepID=A0A6N4RDX8_BLAVI|nr:MAG: NUDIX domain-containing protein [Blastochloris viridis]
MSYKAMITKIYDKNPDAYPAFPANPDTRLTARAVLMDDEGRMAVMFIANKGYHKLPGGGLLEGEDLSTGLARELKEETGCEAQVLHHVHTVEEYRAKGGFLQVSQGYLAKVVGPKGPTAFDAGEIRDDFVLLWLDPQDVLERLEAESLTHDYSHYFINTRERAILKAALLHL